MKNSFPSSSVALSTRVPVPSGVKGFGVAGSSAGGVSANSGLRAALSKACEERGYPLYLPQLSLCGDNAAMIGSQAYYEYRAGVRGDLSLNGVASMPVDKIFY